MTANQIEVFGTPQRRSEHLSFKGNLKTTRYGWLRLTPAYSVHLVGELLETELRKGGRVLDPFCGTGTTALVCAERGIPCDTTDINPFLLWLARTKTATYTAAHVRAFHEKADTVRKTMLRTNGHGPWTPPLHQIEKWWSARTLGSLARGMEVVREQKSAPVGDLLRIAFCRTMRYWLSRASSAIATQRSAKAELGPTSQRPAQSLCSLPNHCAGDHSLCKAEALSFRDVEVVVYDLPAPGARS